MAQYEHLPIYKLTYDLLIRTMTATKDFPREYKYTLGQKMKDEIIEPVVLIYKANSAVAIKPPRNSAAVIFKTHPKHCATGSLHAATMKPTASGIE